MKKTAFLVMAIVLVTLTSCNASFWEGVAQGIGNYGVAGYQQNMFSSYLYNAASYQPVSISSGSSYASSYSSSASSTGYSSSSSSSSSGKMCRLCAGMGTCKTCDGKGFYYSSFDLSKKISCPNCQSNHNGKCSSCGGTGMK